MSGEFEAAGAMATAGLAAGALEGRGPGEIVEGACINCGAQLAGRFCSNCGQAAHPHRTLAHVFDEFLHGLIHFDTKAWRTLPMVIFRPGTLTRNYVYGKRARYISPLAMFLFCVFFMFFAFSFVRAPVDLAGSPQEQRAEMVEQLEGAREALAEAERELQQERADAAPSDGAPAELGARLAQQAAALARAEVARREAAIARLDAALARAAPGTDGRDATPRDLAADAAPQDGAATPGSDAAREAAAGEQAAPAGEEAAPGVSAPQAEPEMEGIGWTDGETWQDGVRRMAERDDFVVVDGMPELNERIRHKLENPDLALYKIQQAAYKFSFLLVPLSLPFIALLFLWKRGTTFYDHVVYALYALSFASLLFVAVALSAQYAWTKWLPGWLVGLGLPAHIFFQLKGAYALGWWSALWRSLFMLTFALVIGCLFVALIVILGLAG